MVELGRRFTERPVLFLTEEDPVHAVSENREKLLPLYRFRLPDDDTVNMLSSKVRFHEFAQKHGFPVPRSVVLDTMADLQRLSELRYPCVLKPDDKRQAVHGHKERAVRADTLGEARECAAKMLASPGGIVVQEWIEGPDSNIFFTMFYRGEGGKVISMFTGRKMLSYPPCVGNTAICVAAPEAREALEPLTTKFIERSGFDGMGSIEYKWDDNYKQFIMVEPTVGRTDWQEEIATLAGVNIPLAAFRHELGLPPIPNRTTTVPVAWRASFADRPPSDLLPPGTKVFDGYFRWSDPFPALQWYCLVAPMRLLRRIRRQKQPLVQSRGAKA
ncbi:carboxylate--amine ligase [Paraburkholderia monticola]|uniref:Carboxylate--amine ligase n=1 Tax=Paraburkholderia monticola TaxID=1399968 RepID=A0A149PGX1_9BURK|nr:carboxylate--amine ligase [Paraburkholderia monticola]